MNTNIGIRGPALAMALGAVIAASCDQVPIDPGSVASAAAGCPDISSVQAIAKFDWAGEFGIDAKAAAKVSGGLQAALQVKQFAARLDADLRTACGGLASDLGASGDWKTGPDACKAAMDAMASVKAKLGAGARIALAIEPPHCAASMDVMADCVAQCDAELDPGEVVVQCEPGKLSGTCEGECSGRCDASAAAKCEGECHGSCNAEFSGKCGGECRGQCNGKAMDGGECKGTCKGSCTASAEGQCGGKCKGSCELSGSATCKGTCTGSCSVEMKAPRCEGAIEPPKASAECQASCDAEVQAKVECTPARVALTIEGAAAADVAAQYKAAIEANLPAILKIAIGMKDEALGVAASVRDVVGGVEATVKSLKAAPEVGARLTACVAAPFKAAFDAAASVKASVDVSVQVQASASASASASGSAKAG